MEKRNNPYLSDATVYNAYILMVYRVTQKMYTLFTHQYLWNKFK